MTAGRSPDARFSLAGETVRSCPAPKEGGKKGPSGAPSEMARV